MTRSSAVSSAALAAVSLVGFSLVVGAPARAADDGYANVFSSMFGAVGIITPDKSPDIEYRERPPLVLPRSEVLPKPATAMARPAAWPQDPDVAKHRKEGEAARAPHTLDPNNTDKNNRLTKAELLQGRGGDNEPVRPNECGNDAKTYNCLVLSPETLRQEGERYRAANPEKSDTLVAGQEPQREFLTQPPKGYMKASRTVKATTEAPEAKVDDSSARYMQQMEQKKREEEQ